MPKKKEPTILKAGAMAIVLEDNDFQLLLPHKDDSEMMSEKQVLLAAIFARIPNDEEWCANMHAWFELAAHDDKVGH